PNNSFKPTPLRYANHMADKACHVLRSTARRGLTLALGVTWRLQMTEGTTGAKTIWLTLLHVVVGTALLFGTLWPYEFTALLPHAYQFANWPFAFKVAVGVAAA